MRSGIAVSALAHSAVLVLGMVSFSNVEPHEPQEAASIDIELIPVEAFSNVREGARDSDVIEASETSPVESDKEKIKDIPAGSVNEVQPEAEANVKETPAPTVETAPEPTFRPATELTPEPDPEPVEGPEPELVEVAKVDEEIAAPQVSETPGIVSPKVRLADARVSAKRVALALNKAEEKKKSEAEKKPDKISKIINEEESRGVKQGSSGKKTAGASNGTAARLSKSERDALAAQMRKCWNPPVAALERDDLFTRLLVDLNRDGTVARTVSVITGALSPLEKTMGIAAQRAVRRCAPYKLSSASYDDWKQVDVTFDPKDLR